MKSTIILLSLVSGIICSFPLNAQTTVELSGVIKSKQGAVQGARVDFFDSREAFLTNATTGPSGTFRSEKKLPVGRVIKMRVSIVDSSG